MHDATTLAVLAFFVVLSLAIGIAALARITGPQLKTVKVRPNPARDKRGRFLKWLVLKPNYGTGSLVCFGLVVGLLVAYGLGGFAALKSLGVIALLVLCLVGWAVGPQKAKARQATKIS
jgi:hypothetical protein